MAYITSVKWLLPIYDSLTMQKLHHRNEDIFPKPEIIMQ